VLHIYLEETPTPSSISNTGLIDDVPVGFSPTSEIDGGGAQHIGGGSPHP
jgi:hypothetical protein